MRRFLLASVSLVVVGVLVAASGAATRSGTVTTSDSTQADRVLRTIPASTCAAPKAYLGIGATGSFQYDSYTFTNLAASAQCVTVTLSETSAGSPSSQLFAVAYLGSFDPANIGTNYLADSAASSAAGLPPRTFSFTVPAGATYVIVVSEVSAGGCGTAGCGYTLTLSPDVAVAVTLRSLSARSTARGVLVRWRTASEVETLAFNVYRSSNARLSTG